MVMVVAAAGEDSFGPNCFKHRKDQLHLPCGITEKAVERTPNCSSQPSLRGKMREKMGLLHDIQEN